MLEKYRSEKSSDRLFLCTIIGAFFVFAETFMNLADISTLLNIGAEGSAAWWLTVGGLLAASLVSGLVVWVIWKRWKK